MLSSHKPKWIFKNISVVKFGTFSYATKPFDSTMSIWQMLSFLIVCAVQLLLWQKQTCLLFLLKCYRYVQRLENESEIT